MGKIKVATLHAHLARVQVASQSKEVVGVCPKFVLRLIIKQLPIMSRAG